MMTRFGIGPAAAHTGRVALYGHTRGESSFAQVTRGMAWALAGEKALAELIYIDHDEEPGKGRIAPISLNCGHPGALLMAHQLGMHREHWLLLAPNGEALPRGFAENLLTPSSILPRGLLDGGLLAPSVWAKTVLEREFIGLPVLVARHGVWPGVHQCHPSLRGPVREEFREGEFKVLHMTSTDTERKGTRLLLEAWHALKYGLGPLKVQLPARARLTVVIQAQHASKVRWDAAEVGLGDEDLTIWPGFALERRQVAEQLYSRAHVVCQPSRGEGFGLCPLEARCCGVVTCATRATGHSEHMPESEQPPERTGVVVIKTGENAPMSDFPGSMAPFLEMQHIYHALAECYGNWLELDEAARSRAQSLAKEWSWDNVCRDAVRQLQERGEHHVRTSGATSS